MSRTGKAEGRGAVRRVRRFLQRPFDEKTRSLFGHWSRVLPSVPFPVRLPFGAWWIGRSDYLGSTLPSGTFELGERTFVQRFLQPGMTVLDIGAHHGFYTLLASKCVGPGGRVYSFEPSPRELKALRLNLALNRCKNVSVQNLALGSLERDADLYVVEERESGCNSLRPPAVTARTALVRVHVVRLDDWLRERRVHQVDFMKLDVEGGELEVLRGAGGMLENGTRPAILAEVEEIRTEPWGYSAKDIIHYLRDRAYTWYRVLGDGFLEEWGSSVGSYDGNFVAFPEERRAELHRAGYLAYRSE